MKLLIMKFSSVCCHVFTGYRYAPRHPVLKHCSSNVQDQISLRSVTTVLLPVPVAARSKA